MANRSKLWETVNSIDLKVGDVVMLSHKRSDGYPKFLEFGKEYEIFSIEGTDKISIFVVGGPKGIRFTINRIYLMPKSDLRDYKLKSLFNL